MCASAAKKKKKHVYAPFFRIILNLWCHTCENISMHKGRRDICKRLTTSFQHGGVIVGMRTEAWVWLDVCESVSVCVPEQDCMFVFWGLFFFFFFAFSSEFDRRRRAEGKPSMNRRSSETRSQLNTWQVDLQRKKKWDEKS